MTRLIDADALLKAIEMKWDYVNPIDFVEIVANAPTVEQATIVTQIDAVKFQEALEQPSMTYEQGFAHGYEAYKAENTAQEPEYVYVNPITQDMYYLTKTTQPAQKEWIGLSDEEIFVLCPYIDHDLLEEAFYRGARAIEAKLKELNDAI